MLKTLDSREALAAGIAAARQRSLAWLQACRYPANHEAACAISAAQDVERWPGILLPGTYNGIMCLDLLGGLADWTTEEPWLW